jgi:predicted kinase
MPVSAVKKSGTKQGEEFGCAIPIVCGLRPDMLLGMATAHLIHGYIGAGKTTFASRLELSEFAVRFTSDDWLAMAWYGTEAAAQPDVPTVHARVEAVMLPVWTRCLTLGVDVVLDLGFWSRASRDAARATVARCGATSRLYDVRCDADIEWRRVERRNHEPGPTFRMTRDTFDALRARFEPLESDEKHILVET